MGSTPSSDIYPTTSYQDPLLYPLYIKTNDHVSISVQTRDDWLLSAYVDKLNQEIIDDIEEFKDHKETISEIFWATRTFGWCGVQFYKSETKVFSSLEWTSWITEKNESTNKVERAGMNIKWTDDLGNTWEDALYFDERTNENNQIVGKCYLFLWQKGNGRVLPNQPHLSAFALPDVSISILALSIQCRQILSTLTYGATNPFFYFMKYGESITPTQRAELVSQMTYVSVSKAIGAKGATLDSITAIENGSIEKATMALREEIGFFASATRLPLSYYLGEKQTGGLGDTGEAIDEIKISRKKEFTLQHFLPQLEIIFTEQWQTSLPNLYNYYADKAKQEQEAKVQLMQQSRDNNEENPEKVDSKTKPQ